MSLFASIDRFDLVDFVQHGILLDSTTANVDQFELLGGDAECC